MLEKGETDLITLGTGALANPDWVKKVEKKSEFNHAKFLAPQATSKDFEA